MPFMGRDWRSPGEAWIKTESLGWQRMKIIESQLSDLTTASQCRHQSALACSWPPSPSRTSQQKFNDHALNGARDKCDETSERSSGHCDGGKPVAKRNHSVSPVSSQDSATSDDQSRPLSSSSASSVSDLTPPSRCESSPCSPCYCYSSSSSRQSAAAPMELASPTNWQCHHHHHSNQQHCTEPQPPALHKTAPHCRISVRTKEVAMHNTISEAFYRLDFYNAIHDIRRFNYICKLLHLLITQNLTSLSGCATRVLFTMLEQVAREVSANKRNINVIRNLLADIKQTIQKYSCWGRPIGSSLLWRQHFETIDRISQIVDEIELSPPNGDNYKVTFDKLPVEMIREILLRLNDYRDLVNSAQASPVMRTMIDNQCVWQKLCRYHFTDQQLKLAFESNKFNLVKKQQQQQQPRPAQLRGTTKYARTTSADGRSSYRSPVVSSAGQQSRSQQITSANRPTTTSSAGRPPNAAAAADPSARPTSTSSSYVTNAVRIFDKEHSAASSPVAGSSSPSTHWQGTTRAQQQQQQQSKANERCPQPSGTPSNGSAANDTARQALEIDWERVFHQLRKRFDLKEEYADCLLLCRHCRCLFWKSFGHPCVKSDESIRRSGGGVGGGLCEGSLDACRHCHVSDNSCHKSTEKLANNHGDSCNRSNQRLASSSSSSRTQVRADDAQRASGRRGSSGRQWSEPQISVAALSRNFDRQSLGGGAHESVSNNENALLAQSSSAAAAAAAASGDCERPTTKPTTTTTKATFSGSSHDASNRQSDNGSRPRRAVGDGAGRGLCAQRQPLADLSAQLREHNFNRQQRQAAAEQQHHQQRPWQQWQQPPRRDPRPGADGPRDRPLAGQGKELVPKHVTISPQAFLKFFSL